MDFYNHTYPKARKPHKCEYCGKEISIGERYSRESGKYVGDFFDRKLCMVCANILNWFIAESQEEEFEWDWISDCLSEKHCSSDCKDDCEYGYAHIQSCPKIREFYKDNESERENICD